MTTSTVSGGVGKMASRLTSLLVLAFAVGMASAQSATISTVTSLPDYEMEDGLLLTVSATDNDVIVFQQFDVVPLTPGSGLNQSQVARNVCVLLSETLPPRLPVGPRDSGMLTRYATYVDN